MKKPPLQKRGLLPNMLWDNVLSDRFQVCVSTDVGLLAALTFNSHLFWWELRIFSLVKFHSLKAVISRYKHIQKLPYDSNIYLLSAASVCFQRSLDKIIKSQVEKSMKQFCFGSSNHYSLCTTSHEHHLSYQQKGCSINSYCTGGLKSCAAKSKLFEF